MGLDKKQILAIFLFKLKMGHKAAETAQNVNNLFGPGTGDKHTVRWWFMKFCKGDKSLKMRSTVVGHQKLTVTHWEQPSKLILLQLQEKFLKNSTLTILYGHLAFGRNWKGEKTQ